MRLPTDTEIRWQLRLLPSRSLEPWWERRITYLTKAGRFKSEEMAELLNIRARARVLARNGAKP